MSSSQDPSSLKSLPLELIQEIFCALPDLASLRAVFLSCASLRCAFYHAERITLGRVLGNEMDDSLHWDSFLVLESWRLSRGGVKDLVRKLRRQHRLGLRSWTLSDVRYVSNIFYHAQLFAADFASSYIPADPGCDDHSMVPSITETRRIERAFLRYHLYSNLFRRWNKRNDDCRFSPRELIDALFSQFSQRDIEQLASMHKYLLERLAITT